MYQAFYYDKKTGTVNSVYTAKTLCGLYKKMRDKDKDNENLEIWYSDEHGSTLCAQEISQRS